MVRQLRGGAAIPSTREDLIALRRGLARGATPAGELDAGTTVVTGEVQFGDQVAGMGVALYGYYESQSEPTKRLIEGGLAVIRGGPVGAAISYVADEATSAALSAIGADKVISSVVNEVGVYGLAGLSNSPLAEEQGYLQEPGYRDAAYLVGAAATVLGLAALGKAVFDFRRGRGPNLEGDGIDVQAALPRVRFSAETIRQMGPAPLWMKNPHRHHILEVNGRVGEYRALVREGQDILRGYGIDPLQGTENLVWAPNKGHTMSAAETLVADLRSAQQAGLTRGDIVRILSDHGRRAAQR